METAAPLTASAVPLARDVTRAKSRLGYIDSIRVLLTVLVVMVHAAVTYGSVGGWFIQEPVNDGLAQGLLSVFVTLCQAFFMGLFFFLSGCFVPGSIDRKGLAAFWKDRLLRLALPFLTFSFLLAKYPRYVYAVRHEYTGSFLDFCFAHFLDSADAGPTWFLFGLLVLSAAYSLWRLAGGQSIERSLRLAVPTRAALLGFALVMAVLMLGAAQLSPIGNFIPFLGFIYLQPAFFPQYLMMFGAGILAYRGGWLETLPREQRRFWTGMAWGCALALPVLFVAGGAADGQFEAYISGFAWQSLLLNLWAALSCTSISLALILGLRERSGQHGPLAAQINTSAFAAYLVHPLVLVAVTTALLGGLDLHPLLKFALASLLAVLGSFLAGWLLRQVPGVNKVL